MADNLTRRSAQASEYRAILQFGLAVVVGTRCHSLRLERREDRVGGLVLREIDTLDDVAAFPVIVKGEAGGALGGVSAVL